MFWLGLVLFCFTHLLLLKIGPGFHFDEAWAAEHALRIAFEPDFWPFRAMTVQTSSWSHYLTALFFKFLAPSVFVHRLSYFVLNLAALLLFASGLRKFSYERAARWLPWVAALLPALVMNHRFAIEITAFHSFCFALIFFSTAHVRKNFSPWPWLGIAVASVLAFTSHVYFLGALGALLWVAATRTPRYFEDVRVRRILMGAVLLVLPFVFFISTEIVWKWKGRALLVFFVALLAWLGLFKARLPVWIQKIEIAIAVLALPFFFNFLVFVESDWLALHHMGQVVAPGIAFVAWLLALGLVTLFVRERWRKDARLEIFLRFMVVLLATSGVVMITQAPRYYEIHFWLAAILLSAALPWAWDQGRNRRGLVAGWAFLSVAVLACNYYLPSYQQSGREEEFRLGVLKESSYDYLPKAGVSAFLTEHACWDYLSTENPRWQYTFSVLGKMAYRQSLGTTRHCPWLSLCLQKADSPPTAKDLYRDANFLIRECSL